MKIPEWMKGTLFLVLALTAVFAIPVIVLQGREAEPKTYDLEYRTTLGVITFTPMAVAGEGRYVYVVSGKFDNREVAKEMYLRMIGEQP